MRLDDDGGTEMTNIPEKIYLNIGEGGDETDDFKELLVTWCEDRIYDNDLEYTRAVVVKPLLDDGAGTLKPCPFCGGEAIGDMINDHDYLVGCVKCDVWQDTNAQWNTRAGI